MKSNRTHYQRRWAAAKRTLNNIQRQGSTSIQQSEVNDDILNISLEPFPFESNHNELVGNEVRPMSDSPSDHSENEQFQDIDELLTQRPLSSDESDEESVDNTLLSGDLVTWANTFLIKVPMT